MHARHRCFTLLALCGITMTVAGCQTASLEDAAPSEIQVAGGTAAAVPTPISAPRTSPATASAAVAVTPVPRPSDSFRPISIIPLNATDPSVPPPKLFVVEGAARTGDFPVFGALPATANSQMSESEQQAQTAEMQGLLKARAGLPSEQQLYARRLAELRALARTHGDVTEREITSQGVQ